MSLVRYLTHPQVEIDPAVPVQQWRLSALGEARVMALAESGALAGTVLIASSTEQKARDTATPLAAALGCEVIEHARMYENDRSSTGYLPGPAFEAMADRFFTQPGLSAEGWERAVDAQARIVGATEEVLATAPPGGLLLVGHGAVGTLLMCHLAGLPISRIYDQPAGGGNLFAFDRESRTLLHNWRALETLIPSADP